MFDLTFDVFKNFIKVVTKKLNFKVHAIYYRNTKSITGLVYEKLAHNFPKLQFVNNQDDDCNTAEL